DPRDLVVGLHACGGLGDALVRAAAASGAAVLLVPCCPQKIEGEVRAPLSRSGRPLDRTLLGLANLAQATAAGTSVREAAHRRGIRHALRLLLADAGVETRPGDESRGINRKQFRRALADVAPQAFARRGLPAPSAAAVREAETRAAREHAAMRRLALPRTMLARPLELAVVLDRAAALEEGVGEPPEVFEAFEASVSPRNLVIRRGAPHP
ncbi:MAG: methyltransferase, partial [Myxococcales bacterium]|nr:methyltransferase [Myxococcales bacterium]